MAATRRKTTAYNPLFDGADAAKETAETAARLRKRTFKTPKDSPKSQPPAAVSSGNNSLPSEAAATAAVAAPPAAPLAVPLAEPTTKTPAQNVRPTRVLIADSRSGDDGDDGASVETIGDVVPAGRRYRPEPPSLADLATPRLYIARDLRSVEFPGWLAAYFPATGEIQSRLEPIAASDPPDGVRVTRLTPEIYADVERQCRKIYDESRGRWADAEVRERVLKMLDRFAVVRDWARRQGWPVAED